MNHHRLMLCKSRNALALAIAIACPTLCSCQMTRVRPIDDPQTVSVSDEASPPPVVAKRPVQQAGAHGKLLPQMAMGRGDVCSIPMGNEPVAPTADYGIPLPETTITPWSPPGIARPWPHDEYLHDGGDRDIQVTVSDDFQVHGLEMEDTIVHFDTIDGRRLVEPSNRVSIYAPRFGAVRQVDIAFEGGQRDFITVLDDRVKAHLHEEKRRAATTVQPEQPEGEIAAKQPSLERLGLEPGNLLTRDQLAQADVGQLHHEDLRVLKDLTFSQDQRPQIIIGIDAALAWSIDQALQVVFDGQPAPVLTGDQRAEATFGIEVPNNPRLRVIKVASKKMAQPGELVDFTIRFDNIGDQRINNVTLIDNLTTRLEYVPDSSQTSRDAELSTQLNDGGSLVLRWAFANPLNAGDGGVVHFQCRVR